MKWDAGGLQPVHVAKECALRNRQNARQVLRSVTLMVSQNLE